MANGYILLLIVVILMQNKGAGLGGVFGGDGNTYSTKRGFEKNLHIATIILAVLFLGLALITASRKLPASWVFPANKYVLTKATIGWLFPGVDW